MADLKPKKSKADPNTIFLNILLGLKSALHADNYLDVTTVRDRIEKKFPDKCQEIIEFNISDPVTPEQKNELMVIINNIFDNDKTDDWNARFDKILQEKEKGKNKIKEVAKIKEVIQIPNEVKEKWNEIKGLMQEVIFNSKNMSDIKILKLLNDGTLRCHWGTAPTGIPNIGYILPLHAISIMSRHGVKVTVLIADVHARMDVKKTEDDKLDNRINIYKRIIERILTVLNANFYNIVFIKGSECQMSPDNFQKLLTLCGKINAHEAQNASAEVVKALASGQVAISHLLYPIMQCMDEELLGSHIQLGGVDQRKIFVLSHEIERYTRHPCSHLMNKMLPAIRTEEEGGEKMSSSSKTKISFLSNMKEIKNAVNLAFCQEKNIENNSLFDILGTIQPICNSLEIKFIVPKNEKFDISEKEYSDWRNVENDFKEGLLHPDDFKRGMVLLFDKLIDPIRSSFASAEDIAMIKAAYS